MTKTERSDVFEAAARLAAAIRTGDAPGVDRWQKRAACLERRPRRVRERPAA